MGLNFFSLLLLFLQRYFPLSFSRLIRKTLLSSFFLPILGKDYRIVKDRQDDGWVEKQAELAGRGEKGH